jgi:hypothetical protein
VQVIQIAAGRGQILPARLRLEQRAVKRTGKNGKPETRRFAVPVLDVEISPGQLMSGSMPELSGDSAAGALTPVPESTPSRPVKPISEQAATRRELPRRSNAAQPVPPTGLEPRTSDQARRSETITDAQSRKLHALFREKGLQRDDALRFLSSALGTEVTSTKDLTKDQASQAIETVAELAAPDAGESDE